jgi:hypothetical protein
MLRSGSDWSLSTAYVEYNNIPAPPVAAVNGSDGKK